MPIIRHKYTKLQSEWPKPMQGNLKINSNINFVDMREEPNISGESGTGYTIVYDFKTTYGDESATVNVRGELLYAAPKDEAKEMADLWKEKKILPERTVLQVGNFCLMRAQMKAIQLANDLDLQSPVQLPKFEAKK